MSDEALSALGLSIRVAVVATLLTPCLVSRSPICSPGAAFRGALSSICW